jgi:hypothetical protein
MELGDLFTGGQSVAGVPDASPTLFNPATGKSEKAWSLSVKETAGFVIPTMS